jgi:ComF family protein
VGPILDLLFPPACAACGTRPAPGAFCAACAGALEPLPQRRCARCALPLEGGAICPPCRRDPPAFDRLGAAFVHGGPVADAVHRLKYRGRREVAAALAPILAGRFHRELAAAHVVAPIPLHASRRVERRYDQAALLAREVARLAGCPLDPRLLVRVRATTGQVGQGRAARLRNLEGAFTARAVPGRRVLLIDDVVTTAATASAASAALKQAGAREVVVVAVSRAE